ncbi:chemotaxis protein CheB [Mucilaginibacter roseus]|uniref:protein-glutamate methylesterase n=1 Tax=Mucilaginibacter roseus TaxID=1528868 RepID=A0ABS8U0X6_9SPHI|nr:chemotaxis protein CheB [Mucilaginibacter roseus]MCD8739713.1 chemotaxis protein CheB [Mucilaginibacter roseus]
MEYNFYVIGIGLSAGGIDPLKEIIGNLPADINAAVVVLSHIPNNSLSKLDRILQPSTQLTVITVDDSAELQAGHLYVMAEGKQLSLENGKLATSDRSAEQKINRTIDHLFISMASDAKNKSLGIILSGAGYDGIEGAKQIEACKGLIIVQDPKTAQFPLMPSALIANDHPDYVLTPADIVEKVINHVNSGN